VSDDKRQQHDVKRTVHYYALLIGVIACVNFWTYWLQGSKLTLALACFCVLCLVGWLVVAKRLVG
jgi:hypothetical protein